jgi:hypothetical protein
MTEQKVNYWPEIFIILFPILSNISICGFIFTVYSIMCFPSETYHFRHGYNGETKYFIDILYFTIYTHTTVGYGDIYPITTGAKVVTILHQIGMSIANTLTSIFALIYILHSMRSEIKKKRKKAKKEILEKMQANDLQMVVNPIIKSKSMETLLNIRQI